MANPQRKPVLQESSDLMGDDPDLHDAVRRMDFEAVKMYLAADPDCIRQLDRWDNNVMHVCVAGLASIRPRGREIMEFLLKETNVDLLQKNFEGYDPLDLAIAINELSACDLIDPYWNKQLSKKHPRDDEPRLSVVPTGNKPRDPQP